MNRLPVGILCLALLLAFGAASLSGGADDAEKPAAAKGDESAREQVWTCSMHPEVRLAAAGKCPICGMALIPAAADEKNPEAPKIVVDEKKHTVSVPAVAAEQGKYKEQLKGAIEYALVGKTGKAYESLFVTECAAEEIAAALQKVGAKGGKPGSEEAGPTGTAVNVFVEYTVEGQKPVRRAIDEFVTYLGTGRPLKAEPWMFTGSVEATDPATDAKVLQAKVTQSIIGLHWADASPLLENPRTECLKQNIYGTNLKELPPAGTAVRIVFEPQVPQVPEGVRRVHVFLTGRVQGVGYRAWTDQQASELGLKGWVWNLDDGRVEAVVEGPKDKVAELLKRMETGPRGARVEKVDAKDETPLGDFREFTRRN